MWRRLPPLLLCTGSMVFRMHDRLVCKWRWCLRLRVRPAAVKRTPQKGRNGGHCFLTALESGRPRFGVWRGPSSPCVLTSQKGGSGPLGPLYQAPILSWGLRVMTS